MGKTKKAGSNRQSTRRTARATQGSGNKHGELTPAKLLRAIKSETPSETIARLKRIGVLTSNGTLAAKYKNWGRKISRTPDASDLVDVPTKR